MCRSCGVAATQSGAVKCTVCGATDFEVISQEMIEKIAAAEGGLEEETTYDGRKLRWSEDARKGLWTMKNAYQRRRVKARVEKRARMTKLDAITLDFARQVIEEETGTPLDIKAPSPAPTAAGDAGEARTDSGAGGEAKLIARDDKKNPLISTFDWSTDAAQRILRVPAGFMRNKTQERVEGLARERALTAIDLGLVEEGIEIGKKIMAEVIAAYPNAGKGAPAAAHPAGHDARTAVANRAKYCGRPKQSSSGPGCRQRERLPQRGELADRATQARRQSRALIRRITRPAPRSCRLREAVGGPP